MGTGAYDTIGLRSSAIERPWSVPGIMNPSEPQAQDAKPVCRKCAWSFDTEEDFQTHSKYHRVLPTTLLSCDYPDCHRIDYNGFACREWLWFHQCEIHGALSTLQIVYFLHSDIHIISTDEDAVKEVWAYWYDCDESEDCE